MALWPDLAGLQSAAVIHALALQAVLIVMTAIRATRGTAIDPFLTFDRALADTRDYADGRDGARISANELAEDLAIARNLATDLASDFNVACNFPHAAARY